MISKELFEEIIGEKTLGFNPQPIKTICGESFDYQTPTIMIGRIEVHLFMHMCKKWAYTKGYSLHSFPTPYDTWTVQATYLKITPLANTEPEAVINACEWILDNE